jgi:DNA (cytosine-5)-methyltransferase 1
VTLTLTDLFAGAGGSSTGAVNVPGVEVRFAANHWDKAVEVHNSNHPGADHLCADISQYDPRRTPRTDLLWASPECTNHSQAKGRKRVDTGQPDLFGETLPDEAAERSRATMWDVVRFAETHRYAAIVVENVIDVAKWAPYSAWLMALDSLGYEHQIVCLNSMHAQARGNPAPQSRDRWYGVFNRKGSPRPDVAAMQRPRAWCPRCELVVESRQTWKNGRTIGRYRQQYVYLCSTSGCGQVVEPGWLPASSAIDWALPGAKIGDREKPLAEKTRRRIAAGIARYWSPVHLEAAGHTYDAADPKHPSYDDPNGYYRSWSTDEVLKTLHTIESKALACPPPFIAELRGGGSTARPTDHPLSTVTASGNHHGLVTPYYGTSRAAGTTDDALGTLTTVDRYALVMRNNTARGDQGQMSTPAHEVLRTLTTAGHQSLITPGDLAAAEAQVDDCLFRMLEPNEVAAGMAFPDTYQWAGTRRERVRMAGNAVTPPAARDLIHCVADSLGGAA